MKILLSVKDFISTYSQDLTASGLQKLTPITTLKLILASNLSFAFYRPGNVSHYECHWQVVDSCTLTHWLCHCVIENVKVCDRRDVCVYVWE